MAAMASGPIEDKMQFRTQVIDGKAQIYFDFLEDNPAPKSKGKQKTNRVTIKSPETHPPVPIKAKPSRTAVPKKSAVKVTFKEDDNKAGVFMTMEEISELVKTVQENTRSQQAPKITTVTNIERKEAPAQTQEVPPMAVVSAPVEPLVQTILAPISPRQDALSEMAEKKRQKWMREKVEMDRMKLEVEYDQLKHQLAPQPQRNPALTDRTSVVNFTSPTAKPPLPPSQDPVGFDQTKTRLIEKKQQQWKQENAEKQPVWNPFGRPGAGASNFTEPAIEPANVSNNSYSYRMPEPQATSSTSIVLNDQTRVPAAMRTNLLFGDVRFENEVKTAKEIERQRWLDDLRKQIEENKRQKFSQQENERRQDFLQENVQPLIQEAADRQVTTREAPQNPVETNRSTQHDSVVQQTYKKILEAAELAKYEKKMQLIEKLKRNGHKTDLLARTLPEMKMAKPSTASSQKTNEKPIDFSSPNKPTKIEPLHLNTIHESSSHRQTETKRDEAVNTLNSTFRSDHSVQTDFQPLPPKQMFSYTREESDLPPQIPNHLVRSNKTAPPKKNVRIRSLEDEPPRQRRPSITTNHSNNTSTKDDGNISQLGTNRSHYGPMDLVHRPLWNYQNQEHREYIPNSRRDPNYERRQRQKTSEQGQTDRTDESSKKNVYIRWKSDTDIQQSPSKPSTDRTRSTVLKTSRSKDDMVHPERSNRRDAFLITRTTDRSNFNTFSSLDKYQHYIPYTRTDEVLDPARAYSPVPQSREPSARKSRAETVPSDQFRQRHNASVQPPPYHVAPSRQDHILQQLSAIKENLIRRQQEVTSSMNAIPV